MICSIQSGKGVHSGNKADKKRYTSGAPVTPIVKRGEHLFGRLMRSQINQGYQDSEKAQNVEEEHHRLNLREKPTKIGIDEERKCDDGVKEKRSMPSLVVITWMVEYEKSLYKCSCDVCSACHQSLPCNDCQPSREVTQKLSA